MRSEKIQEKIGNYSTDSPLQKPAFFLGKNISENIGNLREEAVYFDVIVSKNTMFLATKCTYLSLKKLEKCF